MVKLVILIALVCLGLVSAGGFASYGRVGGGNHYGGRTGGRGYGNTKESTLCANGTLVQLYVKQIQAAITQLSKNASFTDFLGKRKQEVAYFRNAANTAHLASNCTGYFKGLDAARTRDTVAQNQLNLYTEIGNSLFETILRNLQPRSRYNGRGRGPFIRHH